MGARVIIQWQGLDAALSRLSEIEEKAPQSLERQVAALASATEQEWKQNTPRRRGKLQEGDKTEPDGLSFTLNNAVSYYKFVDEDHTTARGWRTKHGYRLAKRRTRVKGKEMTTKTMDFVKQSIRGYLSKFLDNV